MAKRVYSLPRTDQLNKEQRRVLRLKQDGQFLIVGSPGTGKSVVALKRAEKFSSQKYSLFLTFNHVLATATTQLTEGKIVCKTAMSWFYDTYWVLTEGKAETFEQDKMPERKAHKPDYDKVSEKFKDINKDLSDYQVVIDEGQDLPMGWYECLKDLGIENFFIVADQNQQITDENIAKRDLKAVLGIINNEEVIELKENYRNVAPIATLANHFYTDKTSPKPLIPDRPSTSIPILFEYETIEKIPEMILSEYDRDPSKLIGFILPTENKREWYVKELGKDQSKRNNPKPIISSYCSNQKEDVSIDFGYGGIVVLNDKSVKGIEFDTVFIILDDFKMINNEMESLQKRLYVMTSRAIDQLFLFKSSVRPGIVDDILPEDESILKRRKL